VTTTKRFVGHFWRLFDCCTGL